MFISLIAIIHGLFVKNQQTIILLLIYSSIICLCMDKEISQVPMFSKMGKYISNKILKHNRANRKSQRKIFPTPSYDYLGNKQKKHTLSHSSQLPIKNSPSPPSSDFQKNITINTKKQDTSYKTEIDYNIIAGPPVGYYKINHQQIDKNVHTYNFNRSIPHFFGQKYHCQTMTPFLKDIPDTFPQKLKGFMQIGKMPGRQDIKGSIRKFPENPHQNRFISNADLHHFYDVERNSSEDMDPKRNSQHIEAHIYSKDKMNTKQMMKYTYNNFPHKPRNVGMMSMEKMLDRDHFPMFKNIQFAPDYQPNSQFGKARLNKKIIPFDKYSNRDNRYFETHGISNKFNSQQLDISGNREILPSFYESMSRSTDNLNKLTFSGRKNYYHVPFDKKLLKQISGVVPSYLDKTLNNRLTLAQLNLKSLEMNCTKFSENTQKNMTKKKQLIGKSRHFKQKRQTNKENQQYVQIQA